MYGKVRAFNNKKIERFFRSYKWEKMYLEECETGHDLHRLTQEYIEYYNNERLHQSLYYQTPVAYYYEETQR